MKIDAIYNPNTHEVINLACRTYSCCNRMDILTSLDFPNKIGWERVENSPGGFTGPFGSWTHLGTCPRCVGMGEK